MDSHRTAIVDRQDTVRRIRVLTECNPLALRRVLHFIEVRSIVPTRTQAVRLGEAYLEIDIDIAAHECAHEAFAIVVAKLNQLPEVLVATSQ